jgi:ABC-type multidrug transport system fused ATPase/permease subunit
MSSSNYFGFKAAKSLQKQALKALRTAKLSFFESQPIGRVLTRFSTDVSLIDTDLCSKLYNSIHFSCMCLASLITVIYTFPIIISI